MKKKRSIGRSRSADWPAEIWVGETVFTKYLAALRCEASVASTILATAMAVGEPAFAQQATEPSGGIVEEIVVTAQRRSEPLQKVPIAISALSSAQLQAKNIDGILSLQAKIPSVNVQAATQSVVFVRGIGQIGGFPNENSVALYVDDVYYAIGGMSLGQFNNIQQLVVLKGPQGTLFGRNATGGVMQVTTADPERDPAFDARIGFANYATISSSFYGTTGLTDNLAVNFSALYSNQMDGWGRNVVTGEGTYKKEDLSLREKFLYTPTDGTKILVSLDYSRRRSTQATFHPAPGNINYRLGLVPPGLGPYDLAEAKPNDESDFDAGGVSVKLNQELGFANLVSISAFRTISELLQNDLSGGPATPFVQAATLKGDQYTQEVQLLSNADSKLRWQVGTFYYHSNPSFRPLTQFGPGVTRKSTLEQVGTQTNDSLAVYEQVTYPIFDGTNFTEGLRYTYDKQNLGDAHKTLYSGLRTDYPEQSQSARDFTWRFALDQQLAPDIMGYVSYNRGTKSGGFNITSPTAPGYKPEKLDAYESGLKMQLLERRLRLNLAAYYYDYANIQVQSITSAGTTLTNNAAKARMYGLDFETEIALTKEFRLSGNLGLLNSKYASFTNAVTSTPTGQTLGGAKGYDATGNRTPFAPKSTGNITAEYTIGTNIGTFYLTGDMDYYSGATTTPSPLITLPAYTMFNASAQWTSSSGDMDVRLWGANLTDARSLSYDIVIANIGQVAIPGPPRTFGVTFTYHYGR